MESLHEENMKDLETLNKKFKQMFSVLESTIDIIVKEKNKSHDNLDKLLTMQKDNQFADSSLQEMIHSERKLYSNLKFIIRSITTKMEEVKNEMEK